LNVGKISEGHVSTAAKTWADQDKSQDTTTLQAFTPPSPARDHNQGGGGGWQPGLERRWIGKARWLLLSFSISLLVLTACTGRDLINFGDGWSPTAISDGTLFVITKDEELLAFKLITGDNPELIWRHSLKIPDESDHGAFGTPALGKEFIYVGDKGDRSGDNGRLLALKKDRQAEGPLSDNEWVATIEGGIIGGPALAEDQGLVLAGSDDNNFYAFGTTGDNLGEIVWIFPTDGQVWSPPTVGNGIVYFGSLDHHIYALSLEEGLDTADRLKWRYPTGGAVASKPLLLDGMVIVGSFDRKVYALDAVTGDFRWSFDGGDWFWAGAITDGTFIYVASMGGTVYALDKGGIPVWNSPFDVGSPVVSTPVIVENKLVVGTDGGKLYRIDTRNGESLTVFKDLGDRVKAPLSYDGSIVFVGAEDKNVYAFDVRSWDLVWQRSTRR
jgi:outer membrane protein assembly factor BamB